MAKINAAGIFLVRTNGTVLICHPTNHKPDFFSIPKGKIEDGESPAEAAIRETFEETNIDLAGCAMVALEMVNYKSKKKALHPFIVFVHENPLLNWDCFDLKCNSFVPEDKGGFPEMDGYKFASLDEARGLLHETQVKCLDKIQNILDKYNNTSSL